MQRYLPSFQNVIKTKSNDVWVKISVLGTKTNEKESAQNVIKGLVKMFSQNYQ